MSAPFSSATMPERIVTLEVKVKHLTETGADVEERLRRIERNMYLGLGALAVLQILMKAFL